MPRLSSLGLSARAAACGALFLALSSGAGELGGAPASPYGRWKHGPSAEPSYFPIAVWLQSPAKAQQYRQAGFNLYVGLWRGPTEEQLTALKQAGMRVICEQNEVALRHLDDPVIAGWMHGDEPDNAQSLGKDKGYGPPVPPERIIQDYESILAKDPSRPVMLNLGQGVAWDNWYGRGVRTNHPEDYALYVKGGDIVSFDIYPVVHEKPEIKGNLWYVARGVERLVQWTGGKKVVWNCLECTRISHPVAKPTARQVRSEAWMSLIHGSRGLIYFVHEWAPRFNESALLSDPELLPAVTALNRQIQELAPVLNSRPVDQPVTVTSSNPDVPIALMTRAHGGSIYVFAAAMREGNAAATFNLPTSVKVSAVEVLGEQRALAASDKGFADQFGPWDTHLYRLSVR